MKMWTTKQKPLCTCIWCLQTWLKRLQDGGREAEQRNVRLLFIGTDSLFIKLALSDVFLNVILCLGLSVTGLELSSILAVRPCATELESVARSTPSRRLSTTWCRQSGQWANWGVSCEHPRRTASSSSSASAAAAAVWNDWRPTCVVDAAADVGSRLSDRVRLEPRPRHPRCRCPRFASLRWRGTYVVTINLGH